MKRKRSLKERPRSESSGFQKLFERSFCALIALSRVMVFSMLVSWFVLVPEVTAGSSETFVLSSAKNIKEKRKQDGCRCGSRMNVELDLEATNGTETYLQAEL